MLKNGIRTRENTGRAGPRQKLLADYAPLGLTPPPLARLADLALALDRRLLVVAAALDSLQDALLRHLLLQDLHRFFDGIPNFDFEGASEQCLQAVSQGPISGEWRLSTV